MLWLQKYIYGADYIQKMMNERKWKTEQHFTVLISGLALTE